MNALFRSEVLLARRQRGLGAANLLPPPRIWLLATLCAAAAGALLLLFTFGSYTVHTRVSGELVPDLGLITIAAPGAGVVTRVYEHEGDSVAAGAALATVAFTHATASGLAVHDGVRAQRRLRRAHIERGGQAQDAQLDAQIDGQKIQLQQAEAELIQIRRQLATRDAQVQLARRMLQRYRDAAARAQVSALQVEQQEQSVLEQTAQQQALQRDAIATQQKIAQLRQNLGQLAAGHASSAAERGRELALLDEESLQRDAQAETLLQAPAAGLVASRLVEAGQSVQAGQPLLNLLPAGSLLRAELHAPSRAVGFIRTGDRVVLRYVSFPYQKFGHQAGTVLRISRNPVATSAIGGEAYYRVVVALEKQTVRAYGRDETLLPGMRLEADILTDRRRLLEWMLEPVYSLRGRWNALQEPIADAPAAAAGPR